MKSTPSPHPSIVRARKEFEALSDEERGIRIKTRYDHKTTVLARHKGERDALDRAQQIEREALRTKHYRELGVFE